MTALSIGVIWVDKMKRYFITIIVMLVIASGLVIGCGQEARQTPTIQTDTPTLRSDEVCVLVYNYLEARASLVSSIGLRQPLLTALAIARPYFTATYQGNGKWQVSALGYGLKDEDWVFNYGGLWNLYEVSRAIEPANGEASDLLLYIQRRTR